MNIAYGKLAIIINHWHGPLLPRFISDLIIKTRADYVFCIPEDEQLVGFAENGTDLKSLSQNNKVVASIDKSLDEIRF